VGLRVETREQTSTNDFSQNRGFWMANHMSSFGDENLVMDVSGCSIYFYPKIKSREICISTAATSVFFSACRCSPLLPPFVLCQLPPPPSRQTRVGGGFLLSFLPPPLPPSPPHPAPAPLPLRQRPRPVHCVNAPFPCTMPQPLR
jgi:hypothetical protein